MDKKNEITLIIGGSASGKTRLLKAMKEAAGENAEYYYCNIEEKLPQINGGSCALLLDEPFGCLDAKPVAARIGRLARKRKVVVATALSEAREFGWDKAELNVIELKGHEITSERMSVIWQGVSIVEREKSLFRATDIGYLEDVKKEIEERGVNVNARDLGLRTLLHYADKPEIAEYLIKKGAMVDARDSFGATPLYDAAFGGKAGVVRVLLKHGADPNAKGPGRSTPLHEVCHMSDVKMKGADYLEVAKLLVKAGADVNARNSCGYPLLYFAKNKKVIKFLKKHGAKANKSRASKDKHR
ncbi:Putative ankyrin repeat protein [Candidatus Gugararchaeum adminiculabundum]|nr:Putative ankyrin repeat protein [Candidatus Gugararchaeum adminiculabundum]